MIIEKIRGNAFSPLDVLEMHISVNTFCPINASEIEIIKSESVIKIIESVITSGPHWELNPTCQMFFKDDIFNFQKEILVDDVFEKSVINIKELDVHRNVIQILYPVRLFLVNARTLSDEIILKSEIHIIHTLLGKFTL